MKQNFVRNQVFERKEMLGISEGRDTVKTKKHYAGEFAPKGVIINCQTKNSLSRHVCMS
jgi:hypothetical protein